MPSATLSFHLSQVKQAGLVPFRREGRSLIYAAEYGTMNDLLGYLTENCCQGDPSTCGVTVCDTPAAISNQKKAASQKSRAA